MNIPVHIKHGDNHPTISDNVYKGADFRLHVQLYDDIQKSEHDQDKGFMNRILEIQQTFMNLEKDIILRTKGTIGILDQAKGKLIQRSLQDAETINDASNKFFILIKDICSDVGLATKVFVIPSNSYKAKKDDIQSEKIMPGISSIAISKQINDAAKRARSICQRVNILIRSIVKVQRQNIANWSTTQTNTIIKNIRRLLKQQQPFIDSINVVFDTCMQIKQERDNHIKAIEIARNKRYMIAIKDL
jgi:hypothetical protein